MIGLSFDTDHMSEARMREFFALVDVPAGATFFCVETYECMAGRPHEIGPHPFLVSHADLASQLAETRAKFPSARGFRSHSCLYSHAIALGLGQLGFDYASTQIASSSRPQAVREAWGLWQLPIHYMDNADFSAQRWWSESSQPPFSDRAIDTALADDGLYVFGFHPIHVLLNTPSADHYLARRDAFVAGATLDALRFEGFGTADFLDRLLVAVASSGQQTVALADALDAYVETEPALVDSSRLPN